MSRCQVELTGCNKHPKVCVCVFMTCQVINWIDTVGGNDVNQEMSASI